MAELLSKYFFSVFGKLTQYLMGIHWLNWQRDGYYNYKVDKELGKRETTTVLGELSD